MSKGEGISEFRFVGGRLSIDFINTQMVSRGEVLELLRTDADLLNWATQAGLPQPRRRDLTFARQGQSPSVVELRATMRGILERLLDDGAPRVSQVTIVNRVLERELPAGKLVWRAGEWSFDPPGSTVEGVLRAVATDFASLLSGTDLKRLARCSNEECVLLFVDHSRRGGRRWCSMQVCGNRAKVKEHRVRRKRSP